MEAECGLCAVNFAIQSQVWNRDSFDDIAQQLNTAENDLVADGEVANNHDMYGNYTIQVLNGTLNPYGLHLALWDRAIDCDTFDCFIMNLVNHWYTIRKIGTYYWRLDSLQNHPIRMSSYDLEAHLSSINFAGYSVFTVTGIFNDGDPSTPGTWYEEINGELQALMMTE